MPLRSPVGPVLSELIGTLTPFAVTRALTDSGAELRSATPFVPKMVAVPIFLLLAGRPEQFSTTQ